MHGVHKLVPYPIPLHRQPTPKLQHKAALSMNIAKACTERQVCEKNPITHGGNVNKDAVSHSILLGHARMYKTPRDMLSLQPLAAVLPIER